MITRIIPFIGIVGDDINSEMIRRELTAAGGKPVQIDMSSPGGYADEGLIIHRLISEYNGVVICRIVGICASAASYISTACDKVISTDESIYMIHEARGGGYSTAEDHRKSADTLDHYNRILATAYAKRSRKSLDEIITLMNETTYYYGPELLTEGWADEHEGSGKVDAAIRKTAIINAQGQFTSSYHNPEAQQIERIAAALGDISLKPLSKEDKLAAKAVHMTVDEYRKAMAFYK